MPWRFSSFSSGECRLWPAIVALLMAVLAPTACVLWFMNEAVNNERLAVRQRLQDVYGHELALSQNRLELHWGQINQTLDASRSKAPAAAFAKMVSSGLVESAVIYRNGRLEYPALTTQVENSSLSDAEKSAQSLEQAGQFADAADAWAAIAGNTDSVHRARALLAQARSLLHTDRRSEAIALLIGSLQEPEYEAATDAAGRLIAPNAMLLAIESLLEDDPGRPELVHRLADRLRQYDGQAMSSPQRLFLMHQLHQLAGENLPMMKAETLALKFAATLVPSSTADSRAAVHRATSLPDTWIMADSTGQTIGLWSTAALAASLEPSLQEDAPAGATFSICETALHSEDPTPFLTGPGGHWLPDWTIALTLRGPDPFGAAAHRHAAAYLWMACLAIGTIVVLAIGLGMYLRQQMRLTRLKNDLIATVSHELKTPLSSIRVLTDTLIDGRIPSAQEQREYLVLISRENLRLSRLIDNFLAFSRMERSKTTFQIRRQCVHELVATARDALGQRAGHVQIDVPPQLTVMGDADALVTLLVNLLDNAWKYSGDKKEIELTAEAVPGAVKIRVRDNGMGIARRHQRRIFQRFYQVDRQLSRQSGGCGLGLAIVQFIARAHGATVEVISQLGQGSTFCVRLPACPDRPATIETELPPETDYNGELSVPCQKQS